MNLPEIVSELYAARQMTLDRFASAPEADLNERRDWKGANSTLRFHLSWLAEGGETRRVRILNAARRMGCQFTEAQVAVMLVGAARGRLLGLLAGLSDSGYDRYPGEGEWSIRRVLGHVIATDGRYVAAVRHAVERARRGGTGPLRPDEASLPAREGEAESTGSPAELRDRLRSVRWSVMQSLVAIPDDLLAAPTNWVSWDLDVRFRIHRFAAHDREHTIQCEKARQALGIQRTEAQLLLGDAMADLGALEALLLCIGIDIIERHPPDGGPSIAELVDEAIREERALATG